MFEPVKTKLVERSGWYQRSTRCTNELVTSIFSNVLASPIWFAPSCRLALSIIQLIWVRSYYTLAKVYYVVRTTLWLFYMYLLQCESVESSFSTTIFAYERRVLHHCECTIALPVTIRRLEVFFLPRIFSFFSHESLYAQYITGTARIRIIGVYLTISSRRINSVLYSRCVLWIIMKYERIIV